MNWYVPHWYVDPANVHFPAQDVSRIYPVVRSERQSRKCTIYAIWLCIKDESFTIFKPWNNSHCIAMRRTNLVIVCAGWLTNASFVWFNHLQYWSVNNDMYSVGSYSVRMNTFCLYRWCTLCRIRFATSVVLSEKARNYSGHGPAPADGPNLQWLVPTGTNRTETRVCHVYNINSNKTKTYFECTV